MKLVSWNVNGIRAVQRKNAFEPLLALNPDVICLQETKATVEQVKEVLKDWTDYQVFANEAERKGYSGTAIITKVPPLKVWNNLGIDEHDKEGRLITAEFEKFYLLTAYVPNSGSELLRLGYRQQWDQELLNYIKKLECTKPVIFCGDFNVAHKAIDLSRPKANYNKVAGYMQQEIDGMDSYHQAGFVDIFRKLNPDTIKYSWWSVRAGARANNIGWRIDYFFSSPQLLPEITETEIHCEIEGSDHCPVSVCIE